MSRKARTPKAPKAPKAVTVAALADQAEFHPATEGGDNPGGAGKFWTMDELLAEQYPNGAPARVPGGMAIALQRELRRRNRKAEKGY